MLPETFQMPHLRHLSGWRLCPSDRISTVHDSRGPRLSPAVHKPPIRLLRLKSSPPVALIHAPAYIILTFPVPNDGVER